MGTQLGKAIAGNYYERGGRASGVLGILDNMIKQREQQKTFSQDITKQLLGTKEVSRGLAKQAGLPFEQSEEEVQSLKGQKLLNQQREQSLVGSSPSQARSFAGGVLDDLQKDTTGLVLSIKKGLTKDQYMQSARNRLLDVYDILPDSAKSYFDQAVSDLYENTSMAFGKKKPSDKTQKSSSTRFTVTPLSE